MSKRDEISTRRRERAYASMIHLDSIADQLAHISQNGTPIAPVRSRVKKAERMIREAVTAAFVELERIRLAATGDSGNG